MMILRNALSMVAFFALLGGVAWEPDALHAQGRSRDFMFQEPRATLNLNLGYGIPSVGSDLFQEVAETYTLEESDFNAPLLGVGLSFYLNDRMDLAFELAYSRSSSWSEYVDWVDSDDLPIEQETEFTRVPLTVSFKYFLMERGREIGNFSWIPTTWSPYLGVGGGRMYYEFEQTGDFIDFSDAALPIYQDRIVSQGWAWAGHLFGGLQWTLSPQWIVSAEGRYTLAEADLDRPTFQGYEPIDLSGFQLALGFGVRF